MMQGIKWSTLNPLAPWCLGLTMLWACWQLAALMWLVIAPPQPPGLRLVSLGQTQAANVPNIIGFNLFQESGMTTPNPITSPVPAMETASGPMRLEGVFTGSSPVALLKVNNTPTKHYKIGAKIADTPYQLAGVAWDHVTLQRPDGSTARLFFGKDAPEKPLNVPVTPLAAPNPGPISNAPVQAGVTVAGQRPKTVDQALSEARQQLASNPNEYLTRMGLKSTGSSYEIGDNVPAEVRAQLGLRPGDKVLTINGQSLGQPQRDAALLDQVRSQHHVEIQIQRGAQTLTLQQSF